MTTSIPSEADWDYAPGLLEGAMELELTAEQCGLRYWLQAVPQGTLRGRPDGYDPALKVGPHMLQGPFYDAITQEYAFRALAEEKATRVLSFLVASAPDLTSMEFYATQLIDECRHSMVFRNHLLSLGVPVQRLTEAVHEFAAPYVESVLDPLEQRCLEVMRDERDFIGGVVMITVILEGALAPAAELSERKWRPIDPAAAEIDKGAGIDEIRHLTVGADVGRRWLQEHPKDKDRVVAMIRRGMEMWDELPTHDMVYDREVRFQAGLELHADIVGDYEIWPGRRLLDTTPQERQDTADAWSDDMKAKRLKYMGLEDALG
ncbi:VlmB-like protein [Streptomyces sp. NPDC004296]|uniref:VlmB-like protein n=1 Tax=Streptomyces sp. NPDC004296 TaxID=3364697 RepID=UPI0036D1512E